MQIDHEAVVCVCAIFPSLMTINKWKISDHLLLKPWSRKPMLLNWFIQINPMKCESFGTHDHLDTVCWFIVAERWIWENEQTIFATIWNCIILIKNWFEAKLVAIHMQFTCNIIWPSYEQCCHLNNSNDLSHFLSNEMKQTKKHCFDFS